MDDIRTVDLNLATREELEALPGIGEVLAERIIAARPLKSVDDLAKIEGLRPSVLERLRPYLKVTPPEAMAALEAADTAEAAAAETAEAAAAVPEAAAEAVLEGAEAADTAEAAAAETAEAAAAAPEAAAEAVLEGAEAADTAEAAEPEPEPETAEEAEAEPEVEAEPEPVVATTEVAPQRHCVSRREVWGIALTTGLAAFLLAFLLSLGVLKAINGGLRYADDVRFQATARQVQVLQDDFAKVQQSLDTLQRQVADLKSLSDDVQALGQGQEDLQAQIDDMSNTIEEVQDSAAKFEAFLEGLQNLLMDLMPAEGASAEPPAPTETPTPTPTPSP